SESVMTRVGRIPDGCPFHMARQNVTKNDKRSCSGVSGNRVCARRFCPRSPELSKVKKSKK
ncbi:hypothetical protein KKE45_02905, partial [Patescibacteria group bacterium]|nr:hypothetical protein [Patescibacteria group bacterium]